MEFFLGFFGLISVVILGFGIFLYRRSLGLKKNLEEERKSMQRKMYELAILKELGERIGYSLNVQNIIDIITGSLHQFIEYQIVSYMLLQPEKIIFKVHVFIAANGNCPVNGAFPVICCEQIQNHHFIFRKITPV